MGKFTTVLDKTINNMPHTLHWHTHQHTNTAQLLSFMCCAFEDKEGVVHYNQGKISSLDFTFYHSVATPEDGERRGMVTER